MRVYHQRTGELWVRHVLACVGYSGNAAGKNNPDLQHVQGVGPIPEGAYLIGEPSASLDHGPVALHLVPLTGTQTYGRSGFLMHGDSIGAPGTASHGCIIVPRPLREAARDDTDRLLIVLP